MRKNRVNPHRSSKSFRGIAFDGPPAMEESDQAPATPQQELESLLQLRHEKLETANSYKFTRPDLARKCLLDAMTAHVQIRNLRQQIEEASHG